MTVTSPMTPWVQAAMLTIQNVGIGRTLLLCAAFSSCQFSELTAQVRDAERASGDSVDVGLVYGEGHPDQIFIQELNRHGLHSFAQEVALRRRSDIAPGTPVDGAYLELNARARWGILWMESVADEQVRAYPQRVDDTDTPRQALQRIDAFAEQEKESPRQAWLVLKAAWCRWYVCRSFVAAYLATPARSALKEIALQEIRFALEQLEQVDTLGENISATSSTSISGKGAPNANEVSALVVESKLLSCDLLILRAHLYQDQSEERIACGTQMLSLLAEADKRISLEFKAKSQIDLARAQAWNFSGQASKVLEIVQEYFPTSSNRPGKLQTTTNEVQQLFAATASEACRMLGDSVQARKWIDAGGGWLAAPQLALESLILDLSSLAAGDDAGLNAVLDKKRVLAEKFGSYWGQRADSVLVSRKAISESTMSDSGVALPASTASLTILRTEVKQLLAGKQYSSAIEKLRQAEGAAKGMGLDREAIGFAMQTAALQGLQKEYLLAAREFYRASVEYPSSEIAVRSAMNAIAMTQEQLKALQVLDKASKSDESRAIVQSQLAEVIELRTQIWKLVIERWPNTEQGRSAAMALGNHYISSDNVWEAANLWIGLWESVHQSGSQVDAPAENQAVGISFPPEYREYIAAKALANFRLICWLKNQAWLDSNVIEEASSLENNVADRFERIKQRLDKLVLQSNEHSSEFKDSLAMLNGLGWEYGSGDQIPSSPFSSSLTSERNSDRLVLWLDAQIALVQFLDSRGDAEQLKRLEEILALLKQAPKFASTERSHLALMVERSIQMIQLACMAHSGNAQTAIEQLQIVEKANAKDPWWGYYSGRIYQSLTNQRELGLQRFVQIGSAMPAGSDGWIECRARSIQVLRQLGREEEASKLSNMVVALNSKLPSIWLNRIRAKKE